MNVVVGVIVLVALQLLGAVLKQQFSLSVPAPVLGLSLLLLSLLIFGDSLLRFVEPVASWVVKNLALFFIPVIVSAIFNAGQYRQDSVILLLVVSVGTWLAMMVTAWVGKHLLRLD